MQARMKNPAMLVPDSMTAFMALNAVIEKGSIPLKTRELVHLRISQINGCSVCLDMHPRMMKKSGETDARMFTVAAWRDAPYFTDAERAALALAESVTRLADREDAVPDAVWSEACRHYDEPALAHLLLFVSLVNVWNRLNVSTRQVAGAQSW